MALFARSEIYSTLTETYSGSDFSVSGTVTSRPLMLSTNSIAVHDRRRPAVLTRTNRLSRTTSMVCVSDGFVGASGCAVMKLAYRAFGGVLPTSNAPSRERAWRRKAVVMPPPTTTTITMARPRTGIGNLVRNDVVRMRRRQRLQSMNVRRLLSARQDGNRGLGLSAGWPVALNVDAWTRFDDHYPRRWPVEPLGRSVRTMILTWRVR